MAAVLSPAALADDAPSVRRSGSKPAASTTQPATTSAPSDASRAATAEAPADAAEVAVMMTYQDAELKRVDVRGGSLVEMVVSVGEAIANAGLGPERHAAFLIRIKPKYERQATGDYVAALEVGPPSLNLDGRIKADVRAALEREARTLVTRLRNWRHPLTEAELRALLGYDERVDIALPEPFAHIRTWSHQPAVVTLHLKAPQKPRPILRYVTLLPDGEKETLYELPIGQAFWIEAQYYTRPEPPPQSASLEWPGGQIDVPLSATERLLFFRGGPYYVTPPPAADGAATPAESDPASGAISE